MQCKVSFLRCQIDEGASNQQGIGDDLGVSLSNGQGWMLALRRRIGLDESSMDEDMYCAFTSAFHTQTDTDVSHECKI